MSRDPIEEFLGRLHHPALASIDLSLDRMVRLLALLGSPHKRLPPVIHVAGTNGKGSMLAYLRSILQQAGYSVHCYTSPHLVKFSERIILNGEEIKESYVINTVKHVAAQLASQPATFFEASTAAAYLAFAEHKADVLLLETGMGGRLDATNVIEKPLLTAITPIAIDHTEFLGNTLAEIAGEKAGILKKDVPCVVGRQKEAAQAVIEQKAASLNAPLYCYNKDWHCTWHDTRAGYKSSMHELSYIPALAGKYQYDNAATAIACLDKLPQFNVTQQHICDGIASADWPARIQHLNSGCHASLVAGHELVLDGGHNAEGGKVLADWLAAQQKDVYLVCGMMKGKDSAAYLSSLSPHSKELYAVAIPGEVDSQKPEALASVASEVGMQAQISSSIEKALQTIASHAKSSSIVCICGSLYLAGQVLAADEKKIVA